MFCLFFQLSTVSPGSVSSMVAPVLLKYRVCRPKLLLAGSRAEVDPAADVALLQGEVLLIEDAARQYDPIGGNYHNVGTARLDKKVGSLITRYRHRGFRAIKLFVLASGDRCAPQSTCRKLNIFQCTGYVIIVADHSVPLLLCLWARVLITFDAFLCAPLVCFVFVFEIFSFRFLSPCCSSICASLQLDTSFSTVNVELNFRVENWRKLWLVDKC